MVSARGIDRQILALAWPALGALIAEPLLVIVDTAMVGHLGGAQLAGLALASSVLMAVVGLCVFLAYTTTAVTSRLAGSGRMLDSARAAVDALWVAVALGAVLAAALVIAAPTVVEYSGVSGDVGGQAVSYLLASAPGLPGMLAVLAATGALRAWMDTRTPLYVAAVGAVANGGLNAALIWGAGLGVAGSGLGTAITQLLMGAYLGYRVVRQARGYGAPLAPTTRGLRVAFTAGLPLLVRTVSLRVTLLATVWVAGQLGALTLAGHQVVTSVWGLAAFALDALAIAAQVLVGRALGGGDAARARQILARCRVWALGAGGVLGGVLLVVSPWLVRVFTPVAGVQHAAYAGLLVAALAMPLAGLVFMYDGVLIGAGDGVYLAWSGLLTLGAFIPGAVALFVARPQGPAALAWLWLVFAFVFMGSRYLTTWLRARGDAWMRLGQ